MLINHKNIALTGASGGLGQALAHQLALQGANLILVGRNQTALKKLQQSLPHSDRHSLAVADITKQKDRDDLVAFLQSVRGGLDILINNAGVSEFGFISQLSIDTIEHQLQTNLLSPILLCKALVPFLAQKPAAAIINIGSSFGSIGFPGFTSYCASKFGLRGFSEALRRELADTSIKVSYIAPRATKTRINSSQVVSMNKKLGNKMDDPELVAKIILRSIQTRTGRDTYIGWPEKLFVRLNSIWPRLVDGNLRRQLSTIRQFAES